MKLYLSGPITGVPDYRDRFFQAEDYLRHLGPGVEVINPAAFSCMALWEWEDCMLFDLKLLRGADTLVSLPGSANSKGARIEADFARGMGIPVFDLCEVRAWVARLAPFEQVS